MKTLKIEMINIKVTKLNAPERFVMFKFYVFSFLRGFSISDARLIFRIAKRYRDGSAQTFKDVLDYSKIGFDNADKRLGQMKNFEKQETLTIWFIQNTILYNMNK